MSFFPFFFSQTSMSHRHSHFTLIICLLFQLISLFVYARKHERNNIRTKRVNMCFKLEKQTFFTYAWWWRAMNFRAKGERGTLFKRKPIRGRHQKGSLHPLNSMIADFSWYGDRNNVGMHADGGRKRGWSKIIKKLTWRWGLFVFPQMMARVLNNEIQLEKRIFERQYFE